MADEVRNPRDYAAARLLRQTEPYHFQRDRQILNKQPRPPQPGLQPNQKLNNVGWGMSTSDYWSSIMKDYLSRRKVG